MMNEKKRKLTMVSVAFALCVVLMLGGTFAWSSISQTALNEFQGEMKNPGGRLHDDFDGKNKEIYVENFTKQNEGLPIIVRVRLYEYMEIGQNAGLNVTDQNRSGVTVLTQSGQADDIDDYSKWDIFKFGSSNHFGYWDWTFGGSKFYMPTFLLDKDSKVSDINGKYDGLAANVADYTAYTNGQAKSDYEIHDGGAKDLATSEHYATATLTEDAAPMSMADWVSAGCELGNFWVFDEDGWAYWANLLPAQTSTALLLDQVNTSKVIAGKWYYGIYVESQMATPDEVDVFDKDKADNGGGGVGSEHAKTLLQKLAESAGTISVDTQSFEDEDVVRAAEIQAIYEDMLMEEQEALDASDDLEIEYEESEDPEDEEISGDLTEDLISDEDEVSEADFTEEAESGDSPEDVRAEDEVE